MDDVTILCPWHDDCNSNACGYHDKKCTKVHCIMCGSHCDDDDTGNIEHEVCSDTCYAVMGEYE